MFGMLGSCSIPYPPGDSLWQGEFLAVLLLFFVLLDLKAKWSAIHTPLLQNHLLEVI